MAIRFLCPNGHKIHCPEDRAGKPAKCPKCGAKFRVPDMEGAGEQAEAEESSSDIGTGNTTAEEQIEFLCPNGHRLHGPASLQGKPGQCPECGSRFRVPSYDEVPDQEEEQSEQQITLTDADDLVTLQEADSEESSVGSSRPSEVAPEEVAEEPADEPGSSVHAAELSGKSSLVHPLATVVARLWAEKPGESALEIHLAGGETIVPTRFARQGSLGPHGLFASEEADGSFTLTAVPWETVQWVQIRGLKRLPDVFGDDC